MDSSPFIFLFLCRQRCILLKITGRNNIKIKNEEQDLHSIDEDNADNTDNTGIGYR